MKSILNLVLLLLLLVGCKTKQMQTERSVEQRKEQRQTEKDSVSEESKEVKVTVFQMDNFSSFEVNLETEKDSTGLSRELEFERIRSPNGEKFIVRGGKMSIKSSTNTSIKNTKKDTLQVNNTSVRTKNTSQQVTEKQSFHKSKEVKTSPLRWLWFIMFVAGIVILVLLFLQWRFKLFRKFPAIITKIKRYLKTI